MTLDLLSIILPTDLLLYFDIVNFQELGDISVKKDCLHIYLEERNQLPKGYSTSEFESKGFSSSKQVQDFPIRGKAVYLHIKTRRWRDKKTKSKETPLARHISRTLAPLALVYNECRVQ